MLVEISIPFVGANPYTTDSASSLFGLIIWIYLPLV
jgi:hypothetical protein